MSAETKHCALQLRGSPAATIPVSPSLYEGTLILKGRNWNRFEGEVRRDRRSLSLNGRQVFDDKKLEGVPSKGPLEIVPTGPIDFANIYIRDLAER